MNSILLSLVLVCLTGVPVTESASLRDYFDSAAHVVGLDSLVSAHVAEAPVVVAAGAEVARCGCPRPVLPPVLKPLSPCPQLAVVEEKKTEVVIPVEEVAVVSEVTPCQAVAAPVTPCPEACPLDYEAANAKSHSKMWEVAMKGKALATKLTGILSAPVVFTNEKVSAGASLLPGILAAKGRILGSAIAAPVQFAAGKSTLIAKGVHGVMVGVPVAIGTGITAGVAGLMEKVHELRRQQAVCECRAAAAAAAHEAKHPVVHTTIVEPVAHHAPCPMSCPAGETAVLVAAGSKSEEKFTIADPVTDSPVTEAFGGSSFDNQESATDGVFITTEATADKQVEATEEPLESMESALDQDLVSRNDVMMGKPSSTSSEAL